MPDNNKDTRYGALNPEPSEQEVPESINDPDDVHEYEKDSAGGYTPFEDPETENGGNADDYGLSEEDHNEMEENRGSE